MKSADDPRIGRGMRAQLAARRARIAAGERHLGWKLGFGAPASMQMLGIPAPMVGYLLGDALRYTIASVVMLTVGLILGYRPDGGVGGVLAGIALLIVFSFAFSWIWTMFGLLLRTEKSVMGVSMMVLFPLTFLSNVFVDPETLPAGLEEFVDVNPISILATASRGLMHGNADTTDIVIVLATAAALTAIFAPLTTRLYRTRG